MNEQRKDQENHRPRIYFNLFDDNGLPIETIEIERLNGNYFQLTFQTVRGEIDTVLAHDQLVDLHKLLEKALGDHEPQKISFGASAQLQTET